MKPIYYGENEFQADYISLAAKIDASKYLAIYPVPRGGVPLGVALSTLLGLPIIKDWPRGNAEYDAGILVVDDLVDSGATRNKFLGCDFACLHVKENTPPNCYPTFYVGMKSGWVHYWWEASESAGPETIHHNITRLLQFIGEDPSREGLVETPARVIKAFNELFAGYKMNPASVFKHFDADGCDQMVLLKDIEIYSTCEHHMLPFFGKAHIAYIPNKRVIGVSKLARLMDVFARRMQIQERIGEQITSSLMEYLQPHGAACVIEAQHFCMKARGVGKQHSVMVTSSLKGCFLTQPEVRVEFMGLIR